MTHQDAPHALSRATGITFTATHHRVNAVNLHSYASWTLWLLGYPDQALRKSREALELAEALKSHLSCRPVPVRLPFPLAGENLPFPLHSLQQLDVILTAGDYGRMRRPVHLCKNRQGALIEICCVAVPPLCSVEHGQVVAG
jgi:hypothetical protein